MPDELTGPGESGVGGVWGTQTFADELRAFEEAPTLPGDVAGGEGGSQQMEPGEYAHDVPMLPAAVCVSRGVLCGSRLLSVVGV